MHLFGRQVVTEAVASPRVRVVELLIARSATGSGIDELVALAEAHDVSVRMVGDRRIDAIAGDDRRHQGVAAEVVLPEPVAVDAWAGDRHGRTWSTQVLLLDQVHNPANVGMILRTATAAGIDGVVLPRRGTAAFGPLVVKAASGVVFGVDLLDAPTTADALDDLISAGFTVACLDAGGEDLFDFELPDRTVWVLGNETTGVSAEATDRASATVSLPLENGVESLNVAAAAAVLSYELLRRR